MGRIESRGEVEETYFITYVILAICYPLSAADTGYQPDFRFRGGRAKALGEM